MSEDIIERAKAQFDVNRAKEAANRFAEWLLHNPAGTVDISDAALSVWGYPAAVAEVGRLRSENNRINKLREAEINQAGAAERVYLEAMMVKDARIKELEAAVVDGRAQYLLFLDCNPDCTAWNFDELFEEDQNTLRRQARISLKMEEPWVYVQLREAREQIKRLEAAFLDAKAERNFCLSNPLGSQPTERMEKAQQEAREALERIKSGEL